MKSLTAGAEIDAWCTKCRMDLMHRIVAMVQSAPKRVICLTCNSEHNYRAPRTETTASGVHVRARNTHRQATQAADERQHEALGECLSHQSKATCAEREAKRGFSSSTGSLHE